VLVLSGTGSCCYGRNVAGKTAKVGGWGHVLGDRGSGYEIGLRALKAVALEQDRRGAWPKLGARILARLQLNEPEELIAWAQNAGKADIAGLAAEVFAAWKSGDRLASETIAGRRTAWSGDALACARQLASPKPARISFSRAAFAEAAGVCKSSARELAENVRGAVVSSLERESAWGGIVLARSAMARAGSSKQIDRGASARAPSEQSPDPARISPTEQRNPRSMNLDKLSLARRLN